jgi:hypothetical protein
VGNAFRQARLADNLHGRVGAELRHSIAYNICLGRDDHAVDNMKELYYLPHCFLPDA